MRTGPFSKNVPVAAPGCAANTRGRALVAAAAAPAARIARLLRFIVMPPSFDSAEYIAHNHSQERSFMRVTPSSPVVGRPAVDLAAAIARGECSATEVAAAHLDQIERVNPALNAFVEVRREAAL